jgi:hypothetical protein
MGQLAQLGSFLAFMGGGSFILHFIGMEFILLSWIDAWGSGTGFLIRIAMIVFGGILYFVGNNMDGAKG